MEPKRNREEDEIQLDPRDAAQRKTLLRVLGINVVQVIVAGAVGIVGDSTGLLGAALDNLGDAFVYAVSIYAVGRTDAAKVLVARLSGILLAALGLMLLVGGSSALFCGG